MIHMVINPDRRSHERVTQNIINKYHDYLKSLDTTWVEKLDDEGDVYALVPEWHFVFKDGSDWRMELANATEYNRR